MKKGREKGEGRARHLLFAALSLSLSLSLSLVSDLLVSSSSSSSPSNLFETIRARGDDKTIAGVKGE